MIHQCEVVQLVTHAPLQYFSLSDIERFHATSAFTREDIYPGSVRQTVIVLSGQTIRNSMPELRSLKRKLRQPFNINLHTASMADVQMLNDGTYSLTPP